MGPLKLSADAQAILLICSSLGLPREAADGLTPLRQDEWNELARSIADSELARPGALLEGELGAVAPALGLAPALTERLRRLLSRGGQLAIELERLASVGIWVLTRADEDYPSGLRQKLGGKAPVVLFGAGDRAALGAGVLAVVGSRALDEAGTSFADALGRRCARDGLAVVSGAAKGADRVSMTGALEAGGAAIGVLADSLEATIVSRETRRWIAEGSLTLVTPFHPRARFTVGTAMQRNKSIYGLARYALVVASGQESGGTWAGAVEDLKAGWVPLFVRTGPAVPPGNMDLLARGALEFPDEMLADIDDIEAWLQERVRQALPANREDPTMPPGAATGNERGRRPSGPHPTLSQRGRAFLEKPGPSLPDARAVGMGAVQGRLFEP